MAVAARRRAARFHRLRVAEVRPLTDDAIEVTFAVPEGLAGDYDYVAGQHVALRAQVDGHELRRSYSLCRAPGTGPAGTTSISVAIKRDHGGRFSTWAHAELAAGMELDVMSPQGSFRSVHGGHVAGIAAGSGITPLLAVASSVLGENETSRFTLVYANRSTTDVMFLDELADLKDRFPTRFALHHVLSREQRAAPLLSGRIDEERLHRILGDLVLPDTVDEWLLCGPYPLVQLCRDTLAGLGVEASRVHFELFTTESPDGGLHNSSLSFSTGPDTGGFGGVRGLAPENLRSCADGPRRTGPVRRIAFTLDGQSSRVESPIDAHESVLTAALRVRPDVPFACAGGVCGTCRARLVSGSVNMTENYALEPDELEAGYILTCQSHPTSDEIVVDYDG